MNIIWIKVLLGLMCGWEMKVGGSGEEYIEVCGDF